MNKFAIPAVVAVFTSSLLVGCSASINSDLDTDKLQTIIASEMKSQLNLSEEPTVTCPDEVAIEQGNVFSCTAALNGESVQVQVTQDDDQGNVSWEVVQQ